MKTHALKRKSKNKWLIGSIIILIMALSGSGYYYYAKLQASKNSKAIVETSTITTGDIVLSATGPGTLISNQEVSFGFRNSGQISEVLVKLGDKVEAGQVLAKLESTTLNLEYQQAEASLAALSSPSGIATAKQAVEDAKTSLATAKNKLQYLIGTDMINAEDAVINAQQELKLAEAIATKNSSTENQQKVTEARAALTNAEKLLTLAQYHYASSYTIQTFTYPVRNDNGVTTSKELDAPTDSEISSALAAYELAKVNVSDAQNFLDVLQGIKTVDEVPASSLTQLTEAQTTLDQAKANLDAAELKAPISGQITSISLNVGDNIGTGAAVTISNTSQPYILDVNLDETDWDKGKIGYTATVSFDMLPNKSFSGKVIQVYPTLDDSSGISLVHVIVQLDDNIGTDLPAGATASIDVIGGKSLGAILAPTSAVKENADGTYVVYLVKNGQTVEQQVEIGLQDYVNTEIKSGLKTGDVVLTNATPNN